MKNKLTLYIALSLCLFAAESMAQRGRASSGGGRSSSSISRGSSGGSRSFSRPSGGSRSYSRPSPSRSSTPSRSYSRPQSGRSTTGARPSTPPRNYSRPSTSRPSPARPSYSSPSRNWSNNGSNGARGDEPIRSKPLTEPRPNPGKPGYPTQTRPRPDNQTSPRPAPITSRPTTTQGTHNLSDYNGVRPGGQLNTNNIGTANADPIPGLDGPRKQETGDLPPNPNDGPAGQQLVTICYMTGPGQGVTMTVTQSRADGLVGSGAAIYGSCSGDISGTIGNTGSGTPHLPPDDGPPVLDPTGTLGGTPNLPGGGGPPVVTPGGTLNGTPNLPGGGHGGGGYNPGPGGNPGGGYYGGGSYCPPSGGGYYGGGGYCPPSGGGYYGGGSYCPPSGGGYYAGSGCGWSYSGVWGGCNYTLSYPFVASSCLIADITTCAPDRRIVILDSDCGSYHWKIYERRVRRAGYYVYSRGCRQYVNGGYEWRVVKRRRISCDQVCGVCYR